MAITVRRPAPAVEHRADGEPVRLPPGPRFTPRNVLRFVTDRPRLLREMADRHGPAFTMWIPGFGTTVVLTEPAMFNELFHIPSDVAGGVEPSLDVMFGDGSIFGKQTAEHKRHRRVLTPPFHGRNLRAFESLVEEETRKEIAGWPVGRRFATITSTNRIALNIILRVVFGAEGAEFDELRELTPKWIKFGAVLFSVRPLQWDWGPLSPWRRHLAMRRQFDDILERLIVRAQADPGFEDRTDILSLMLRARHDDGTALTHEEIGDELVTLVAAGHETTATSLAWAFERLSRHPHTLGRLVAEIDEGGATYLQATIHEVMRTRPTIDGTTRRVLVDRMRFREWVLPHGVNLYTATSLVHNDPRYFPRPDEFAPDRFLGRMPDTYAWTPFGGGVRRCVGATFATMEMAVILRTVLTTYRIEPTDEPDERIVFKGLPFAPARGGLISVTRRERPAASPGSPTEPTGCPYHHEKPEPS
ncbi:putative cytochrome P450 138 [Gordonia spumicola]|uniref:Putative cytochrome P450 138 n=1 Tax=Gordonia spumicola TaxID=589161 RepID=A0A7I9VFL5_9ACTN|nr:cytochrome P450 [Gordonia spumicola]GEE03891.1 putative cytochrome P450 138 [Gordonia spumicola]